MYYLHNFCKVAKIKPLFKKRKNRWQVQLQVHILTFSRMVFHAINFSRLRKLQAISLCKQTIKTFVILMVLLK